MRRRDFALGLAGLAVMPAVARARRAKSAEAVRLRIARQYGLPYLPMMVMEQQLLIEKHGAAQGVPGLRPQWTTLGGTSALTDGLLGGALDFIVPGVPALATLWDKTAGTAQEVRALSAVQSMPFVLVTRNPAVKTIADFGDGDRIALPAVKISAQAVALEMAAAKLWGFAAYDRLDALTAALPHPEAVTALLAGNSPITSHYTVSPFYHYELANPALHAVLKSYDTLGGKHTNGVLVGTKRFHDAHPKACAAVFAAQQEANAFIAAHPYQAGEIYVEMAGETRSSPDEIARMVADPDVEYTTTPRQLMTFVEFMRKVGRIERMPSSWKDLFLPQAHALPGS
jgi:NitT/TauT family transport system substrate-binding protein